MKTFNKILTVSVLASVYTMGFMGAVEAADAPTVLDPSQSLNGAKLDNVIINHNTYSKPLKNGSITNSIVVDDKKPAILVMEESTGSNITLGEASGNKRGQLRLDIKGTGKGSSSVTGITAYNGSSIE